MGRIIKTIEIEGNAAAALFETGAMYIDIREVCFVEGKIEGLDFFADVVAVESLGRADGHDLDAIIGARTMEQWEMRLDPRNGTLDLEGLRRREFTEY